jgi:predicted negative regulator of RcsB-dependent stress response
MGSVKIWAKENPKKAIVVAILVLAVLAGLATGASA